MSKEYFPRAKKRFGQNFLTDQYILDKIIETAGPTTADTVIEIGMGTGILTEALAQKAGKVIGIEIDKELFPKTKEKLEKYMNVNFIVGDFLEKAEEIFNGAGHNIKVIANIPYYITTPIIEKLLQYRHQISSITLMVQKEVAQRMAAKPATKAYGSLSVFVQYYTLPEYAFTVPPTAFRPPPKVESAVIKLTMRTEPGCSVNSEKRFFKVIHGAFWGRRKTLRNTLRQSPHTGYDQEKIEKIEKITGIDLSRRGETLSLDEFAAIANIKFD